LYYREVAHRDCPLGKDREDIPMRGAHFLVEKIARESASERFYAPEQWNSWRPRMARHTCAACTTWCARTSRCAWRHHYRENVQPSLGGNPTGCSRSRSAREFTRQLPSQILQITAASQQAARLAKRNRTRLTRCLVGPPIAAPMISKRDESVRGPAALILRQLRTPRIVAKRRWTIAPR